MGRPRKNLAPDFLHNPHSALRNPKFWTYRTVQDVCEAIGILGSDDPGRAFEISQHVLVLAERSLRHRSLTIAGPTFRRTLKVSLDPEASLSKAEATVRRAWQEGICALVEATGAHGTALRRLDRLDEAMREFEHALRLCRCEDCLVRIRRRQTYLSIYRGDLPAAWRQATQALRVCRAQENHAMEGRVLLARATVYYEAGRPQLGLADARRALSLISPTDEHYVLAGLQNLACCLAATDQQEDWQEALAVISRTLTTIGKIPGLRVLKIRLRWTKVLVLQRLGQTSQRTLAARMMGICEDLFTLGLARDAQDAAASASDLALLGAPAEKVRWAAEKARELQKDHEGPLAEALERLHQAGQADGDASGEIYAAAQAVRASCPGAWPLPGCLRAA